MEVFDSSLINVTYRVNLELALPGVQNMHCSVNSVDRVVYSSELVGKHLLPL